MKVIIAGGRTFTDYGLLCQSADRALSKQTEVEIVSGTAKGADLLGERYAADRGYPVKKFPADWDRYGKSAGYRRNAEMAEYADALIAFWDGTSRGTKHMIDLAHERGLKVRVISY
jgi:glycerophosphoryl diester phosphodiesterase